MFNLGDRVLAQWPAEKVWWYPGTVVSLGDASAEIQFDDGDRSEVELSQIRELAVQVGTRVYCRWQAGQTYYPGKVSEVIGHAMRLNYDDGDQEWTAVSMIRINQNDL